MVPEDTCSAGFLENRTASGRYGHKFTPLAGRKGVVMQQPLQALVLDVLS